MQVPLLLAVAAVAAPPSSMEEHIADSLTPRHVMEASYGGCEDGFCPADDPMIEQEFFEVR